MAKAKYVYFFGGSKADGSAKLKNLLGGKGCNLAEMARRGFNVPSGITITTEVCTYYYDHKRTYPKTLKAEIDAGIKKMEKVQKKKFGDAKNPLLVAVRSGARESMPGMMDTVLNLGLNDKTVEGLKALTGDGRFAFDCYRRFIQMYGDVVMGVQKKDDNEEDPFEEILEEVKHKVGAKEDNDLNEEALRLVIKGFAALIKKHTGKAFPQDVHKQLEGAIGAVFGSWMNERAILYRSKYGIPAAWGTAVNVQSMVFGNMGDDSATGVAFTRNPANGVNEFYGEYLVNAQGEDVVAGIRTPLAIADMAKDSNWKKTHKELEVVRKKLEKEFGDVQDFEFTIENKELFLLQTRNGKRTAQAYVKIAHDMVKQKLMTPEHAISSADPEAIEQLLAPVFERSGLAKALKGDKIAAGLPAGPGAASGLLALTAEKAEEFAAHGPVVLARIETSPEDLRGMIAANGILTAKGGVSSHAAVVARQMGKVCVAGAGDILIDNKKKTLSAGGKTVKEGEFISINGSTGDIFAGKIETAPSELIQVLVDKTMKPKDSELFKCYDFVMKLADKARVLGIRTNADQPDQAINAVAFGAEGIGLCRTEHMFFEGDRIDHIRELIMYAAEYSEYKEKVAAGGDEKVLKNEYEGAIKHFTNSLKKLQPIQQKDFEGLFKAMDGKPVTVRYLDPPLHEFLPQTTDQKRDLADKLGISVGDVENRCNALHESNPMLGHRGCRLGIVYPEISEMQTRAIIKAAISVAKKTKGKNKPQPEIMIPLVGFARELELQLEIVHSVAKEEMAAAKTKIPYKVGTMIEIPRAALTSDEVAEHAEFFSFGTNDLTQTCLGMSRDDAGTFLPHYAKPEVGIVDSNPFASLDQTGVGKLVKAGVEGGRKTRPNIKLGICGEHGGDPASIEFCHAVGLNYVSCSPFRVPVARLAAAKAAVKAGAKLSGKKPAKKKAAKAKKAKS